ncbi:rhodanese-like domain-containing protein [Pedobacter nototheniae]|uniref:rhodanese-like domain-containing protein n=1 Tax=Pedobacter nototheniae TaxID=2488994 RepID=UPI0029310917|nr:rhodanese-like domain-containing protein [Pedobacter nototheniae]
MKIIFKYCLIAILLLSAKYSISQESTSNQQKYKKALVNYDDFKSLVSEVENHRKQRLINLDTFLKMSKEKNVIILDARSTFRYKRKHLKGAVSLSFTDFTQQNLNALIPDVNTKILIYCNNNFEGDQIDFASKVAAPKPPVESQILSNRKPIMLALNVPTYINLYGYGYRNVYELDELVNIKDQRIKFEGTVK